MVYVYSCILYAICGTCIYIYIHRYTVCFLVSGSEESSGKYRQLKISNNTQIQLHLNYTFQGLFKTRKIWSSLEETRKPSAQKLVYQVIWIGSSFTGHATNKVAHHSGCCPFQKLLRNSWVSRWWWLQNLLCEHLGVGQIPSVQFHLGCPVEIPLANLAQGMVFVSRISSCKQQERCNTIRTDC